MPLPLADPAAEQFNYPVSIDVRDLITLDDVAEELGLGPNGGLLYCMEFLEENLDDWLGEELEVGRGSGGMTMEGLLFMEWSTGDVWRVREQCTFWELDTLRGRWVLSSRNRPRRKIHSAALTPSKLPPNKGFGEDDYLIIDCPGQIELYSHVSVFKTLTNYLKINGWNVCAVRTDCAKGFVLWGEEWNLRALWLNNLILILITPILFPLCPPTQVYCMDSQFVAETPKFVAGCLAALSAMVQLELPHVNMLTKVDLVADREALEPHLIPDALELRHALHAATGARFSALNDAIVGLLDEFAMVSFTPLDIRDEESVSEALLVVDTAIQYGEDQEVRQREYGDFPEEEGGEQAAEEEAHAFARLQGAE